MLSYQGRSMQYRSKKVIVLYNNLANSVEKLRHITCGMKTCVEIIEQEVQRFQKILRLCQGSSYVDLIFALFQVNFKRVHESCRDQHFLDFYIPLCKGILKTVV